MKKITIVNKFGPASSAITGRNAKEIADFLHAEGVDVEFVCLKAEYLGAAKSQKMDLPYRVKELKSVYSGRSPAVRLLGGLIDGFRLWAGSMKGRRDLTIVMTDPPLLFFWFQLFRRFSKRRLAYWTMDLYPEAFVAGKYISESNIIYRLFHKIVYGRIPKFAIVLGTQQYAYLKEQFKSDFPHVVIPCGIIDGRAHLPVLNDNDQDKIIFGYGGNIGEAHDANFLVSFARNLDPAKHKMIVSLYGSKAEEVKKSITGNPNVVFRDFLNLDDIASLDVNIATLLPEWNHICVPSKAVTAVCCGSPLLLNAAPEADNWQMFREAGWLIPAGTDYDLKLQQSLAGITKEGIGAKRLMARKLAVEMIQAKDNALKQLLTIINTI